MKTYTLKVAKVIIETHNSLTICFKQPTLRKIKYLSGQYLTLVININGRRYKRPYSLSSAPETDSTLNITIKRVPHGIVSNHLIDMVKEGDMIEVIEPLGNFVYDPPNCNLRTLFLWGAGSGVTPLFSIAKAALKSGNQIVNLYYSNSTLEDVIFYNEIEKLKAEHSDRFFVKYFFTRGITGNNRSGRICANDVIDALSIQQSNFSAAHYICGPQGLKEMVKNVLLSMQSAEVQIYSEDFEHIVNEKEFEGIETRYIKVEKGADAFDLEVVRGRSVLDACLDTGLDIPYSCQTGNCTLCRAILISGDVKVITSENPLNNIAENERLLCCSYPLTADVKFQIPNIS
jgi:ring-1,2-phenylacetyl-CoA epoxidase subunit PaaE